MTISVINAFEVAVAIEQLLLTDPALEGVRIDIAEDWETSPDYKGWIGIYNGTVQYPPRALGAGAGFRNEEITMVFLVKEQNPGSGRECSRDLNELVVKLMNRLLTDSSFGNTVDMLGEDIQVTFDTYDRKDSVYIQKALVAVTGIVRVSSN